MVGDPNPGHPGKTFTTFSDFTSSRGPAKGPAATRGSPNENKVRVTLKPEKVEPKGAALKLNIAENRKKSAAIISNFSGIGFFLPEIRRLFGDTGHGQRGPDPVRLPPGMGHSFQEPAPFAALDGYARPGVRALCRPTCLPHDLPGRAMGQGN